jgi:ubiquinone/menaquinone biosynthesis C-methylase UbiE
VQISLYDNSAKVLKIAEKNINDLNPSIYSLAKDLPLNHFDCVVLSLVLMTIDNEDEITQVLNNIYQVLIPGGTSLIAVTHPCFREYRFSTFHTSYTKDNFNYLNNGEPFSVTLQDDLNGNDIAFTDFHWSLSYTINNIIKAKLQIESIHEIKDKSFKSSYENPNFCPYMIICARKLN